MQRLLALLGVLAIALATSAAPAKKKTPPPPVTVAPVDIPHSTALFLVSLSKGKQVTFKATAVATRFFFEEPSGVTVYRFIKGDYQKEEFLKGYTLARALKRYDAK